MSQVVRSAKIVLPLFIAVAWLFFELHPPTKNISIPPAAIRHELGKNFIFVARPVGIQGLIGAKSNSSANPTASTARLYENGKALGPSHAAHSAIRKSGDGRFNYWDHALYFSSSDGTSPTSNGRQYTLRLELTPSLPFTVLGVLAIVLLLRGAFTSIDYKAQNRVRCLIEAAIYPPGRSWDAVTSLILLVASVAGAVAFLIHAWATSHTVNADTIGSLFQVSDAGGYADCAKWILDHSTIPGPIYYWCSRRTIYPSFLATVTAISGRDWLWTLLIQCALVGLALGIAAAGAKRAIGFLGAAAVLWYQFSYAEAQAFGATMTENAGLIFGALGAAVLIDGARRESLGLQCFGAALLSVALNARSGAFFVLPALVLWGFSIAKGPAVNRLGRALAIILAATAGFLLQFLLAKAYGAPTGSTQSNFAFVLYGLSVGGKGWAQIHVDHPELFHHGLLPTQIAGAIYQFAEQNILNSPADLLKGLIKNIRLYLANPMFGLPGTNWFGIKGAPWWLGLIVVVVRWRDPVYRLLALVSVGVIISSGFLTADGGPRLFAATWPLTAAQAGVAIAILARALVWILPGLRIISLPENSALNLMSVGTSILLLAAILVPVVVPGNWLAAKPQQALGCPDGEQELVTRFGRESYMIALLRANSVADFWKSEEDYQSLKTEPTGRPAWAGLMDVVPPTTVIRGYQLANTDGIPFGTMVPVYATQNLGPLSGKMVSICFGPDDAKTFAYVSFSHIHSVRVIADSK